MATDWSIVKLQHVKEACARYDTGAASPSHPARNTFLLFSGKRYPGKFIRGLAYKLATGRKPGDYQGGADTVAFFTRLGLPTDYGSAQAAAKSPAPIRSAAAQQSNVVVSPKPVSDTKAQKLSLLALLKNQFDDVRTEANFEWLAVPSIDKLDECLATIHSKLRSHRGHHGFATEGFRPCCDYFVPKKKLLIEYDERQHFTLPRSMSLTLYPSEIKTAFNRSRWIDMCEKTRANDPTPPYRDEQRAFYDTLRDILAARNDCTLIRMMHGDFDWTSTDAAKHLDDLLRQHGIVPDARAAGVTDADREIVTKYLGMNPNRWLWEDMVQELLPHQDRRIINAVGERLRKTLPWKTKYRLSQFSGDDIDELVVYVRTKAVEVEPVAVATAAVAVVVPEASYTPEVLRRLHDEGEIQKIALVSHDYNRMTEAGLWDYSAQVKAVNLACDEAGCDTILYALYTWDIRSSVLRTHEALFEGLKNLRRIVMEVGNFSAPKFETLWIETWLRDWKAGPAVHRQRFATSQQAQSSAAKFISDIEGRRLGTALLMICGETNIASLSRASGDMYDPQQINRRLQELNVKVILNPIHDYMRRYEMKEKRRYYSMEGRTVVSVWNQGKGSESSNPWTIFHDGIEQTSVVRELPSPVPDRRDIRIGVLSLDEVSQSA